MALRDDCTQSVRGPRVRDPDFEATATVMQRIAIRVQQAVSVRAVPRTYTEFPKFGNRDS